MGSRSPPQPLRDDDGLTLFGGAVPAPGWPVAAPAGSQDLKIDSGRRELTTYWPSSTISEIFMSTVRLQRT
jgi:hypothetical protein